MRKLIILCAVIILVSGFIFFCKSEVSVPVSISTNQPKKFIIGCLENGAEGNYTVLEAARFNLWHRYNAGNKGWITVHNGWKEFDSLNAALESYKDGLKAIINSNNSHGMQTLMNRVKIIYLCFGQRSEYQCEDESNIENKDLWFYTYKDHETGRDIRDTGKYGAGEKVRYCDAATMNSGYVVKKLKANREQINNTFTWGDYAVDSSYKWYIEPRIRIDSGFAANSDGETPVCDIEILRFDGSIAKTVTLKIKNFKINGRYSGEYKEFYNFSQGENILELEPKKIASDNLNPIKNNSAFYDENCKVDFRVKWQGKCSMWIDYIRVENQTAKDLFAGFYERPGNEWLKWEAKDIAEEGADKFYIEEFEFNQLPCMKYVNKKLDSLSGGKASLMCDLNYAAYKVHIPGFSNFFPDSLFIKRTLVDYVGSKEIFMGGYPFLSEGAEYSGDGKHIYIPNSLPHHRYDTTMGVFGLPTNPGQYDDWLNKYLDEDKNGGFDFIPYLKKANNISRQADIPFINLVQTHIVRWPGHHLREPTNEEINLMVNLGISYGAKGTIYFWMQGYGALGRNGTEFYTRGLGEPNSVGNYSHPRDTNVYGQKKWENIIALNKLQEKWGKEIIGFDNTKTHSFVLRTEAYKLYSGTFFNEIITFRKGSYSLCGIPLSPDGTAAECPEERYLQAAVFNNPLQRDARYFMIVNRRCSPVAYGFEDGRRYVRIKIDGNAEAFSSFNRWDIIDLGTDTVVFTFNRTNPGNIDLGWFNPGEGKLYKLVPVN